MLPILMRRSATKLGARFRIEFPGSGDDAAELSYKLAEFVHDVVEDNGEVLPGLRLGPAAPEGSHR